MNRQAPITLYRSWKRTSADIGCVFARYMAANPERFGQRAEVVRGRDPAKLAQAVGRRITAFVNDPEIVAATLVLPDVNDLACLAKTALALALEPLWTVTRTLLPGTPVGDVVAFNVVRDIPMQGGGTCPSETLLFGPFRKFPKTRKAPVTALEMFVGAAPTHQRDGKPTVRAHLADVVIDGLPAPAVFDSMWDGSKSERRRSLGGMDDPRAKAKVSFVIPMAVAMSIRCVP